MTMRRAADDSLAPSPMARRGRPVWRVVAVAVLALAGDLAGGLAVHAATPIYTCIDASGRKLTSDRPIFECLAREQRELNSDASVRRVLPPTLTPDELAEVEARERAASTTRAMRQDAMRRDRNLLARFPNEAAHRKARVAALDDVRSATHSSQARLTTLAIERKPLLDEAEFYAGKPLPLKLKAQLDANDASTDAQRALLQNQQVEGVRINQRYDLELTHLKRLWAGAAPGSISDAASGAASGAPRSAASGAGAATAASTPPRR